MIKYLHSLFYPEYTKMEKGEFYDFEQNQSDEFLHSYEHTKQEGLLWADSIEKNYQEVRGSIFCNTSSEIDDFKSSLCQEKEIINEDLLAEEEKQENTEKEALTKWEDLQDWFISFDFQWTAFEFDSRMVNLNWEWFDESLLPIKEKTIKTANWEIFIVKEGAIYDWNKSTKSYVEQISKLFSYSDQKEIFEAIRKWIYSWNQKYDFENYDKNINLLSALKYLWLLQNSTNPQLTTEYIQELIWYYNSATNQKKKIDVNANLWGLKDMILKSIG